MVQTIDLYDNAPYGKSHEELADLLLSRSHATWEEAGQPVAPPDPRGHLLVYAAKALTGLVTLMILAIAGVATFFGEETVNTLAANFVPDGVLPDGADKVLTAGFAVVLGLTGGILLSILLDRKGKKLLRLVPQDPQERVSSGRYVGERIFLWSAALFIGAVGLLAFVQPFIPLLLEPQPATPKTAMTAQEIIDMIVGIVGLFLFVRACYVGREAWQLGQPSASELQAKDKRPPVLLLRSFHDEGLSIVRVTTGGKGETQYSFVRLEEAVADQFRPYGPLVAIGRPGEPLPETGAARNYYSDAEWQAAITKWMDAAQIILLVPGLTKGLGWELDTIEKRGHISKLLILMPPAVGGWGQFWRTTPVVGHLIGGLAMLGLVPDTASKVRHNLQQRWDIVRAALGDVKAFAGLPEAVTDGTMLLYLDRAHEPTVIVGPGGSTEDDYERAVRVAVYGMQCAA